MNKQELIEKLKIIDGGYGSRYYIAISDVFELLEQLDEPQPIKSKDIIARIKSLDVGTQEVWLNKILKELGSDYGSLKYRAGYEQGRFDCAMEREKVTVPQFVADWYEENKDDFETNLFNTIGLVIRDFEDGDLSAFEEWILDKHKAPFQTLVNMHQFGYEVEKEKRYYVRFKNMESNDFNYLNFIKFQHAWVLSSIKLDKKFRTEHTKKQLEEAGFGWVFDCEGIEIEEVEE
nr:MAG TPA: Protein of unknown function (DUF1642) [Caudoviricetes sp.]